MDGERWWFNIASGQVESDRDPGRRGDRMGPYPTREAASRALESARLRTIAWEAPDGASRGRTTWTPPPPAPLTRTERWILEHRRAWRVLMFGGAAVMLVVSIAAAVYERGVPLVAPFVLFVFYGISGVRMAERRARELGEET